MPKRDLERMRGILLLIEGNTLEEFGDGWVWARGSERFAVSDEYQITLLEQAGFLEVSEMTMGSIVPDRLRVTFLGHDYLDAIRDSGIWEKTKSAVAESGGNATIEIIKSLAVGFIKKQIKAVTDVEI